MSVFPFSLLFSQRIFNQNKPRGCEKNSKIICNGFFGLQDDVESIVKAIEEEESGAIQLVDLVHHQEPLDLTLRIALYPYPYREP